MRPRASLQCCFESCWWRRLLKESDRGGKAANTYQWCRKSIRDLLLCQFLTMNIAIQGSVRSFGIFRAGQ